MFYLLRIWWIQPMVIYNIMVCFLARWFGFLGFPKMKGIVIDRDAPRIPNHRAPNQQLTISWIRFRKKHLKKQPPTKTASWFFHMFPASWPLGVGCHASPFSVKISCVSGCCAAWTDRVTRFLTKDSRHTPFVEKPMGNTHESNKNGKKRIQKSKCKEGTKNMPDSWLLTMTDSCKMWPLITLVHLVFSIISSQWSYNILSCASDWDVTVFWNHLLRGPKQGIISQVWRFHSFGGPASESIDTPWKLIMDPNLHL